MAAPTADDKNNSCNALKASWPYIYTLIQLITHIGAGIQIGICIIFIFFIAVVIAAAICISYRIHKLTGALDLFTAFTGFELGSSINSEVNFRLFIIVIILVLLALGPIVVCINLYTGLQKNRPLLVWQYIVAGIVCLGMRIYAITSYEWYDSEDHTVLYCALYGLYLFLLIINCVEMERTNRQQLLVSRASVPYERVA